MTLYKIGQLVKIKLTYGTPITEFKAIYLGLSNGLKGIDGEPIGESDARYTHLIQPDLPANEFGWRIADYIHPESVRKIGAYNKTGFGFYVSDDEISSVTGRFCLEEVFENGSTDIENLLLEIRP